MSKRLASAESASDSKRLESLVKRVENEYTKYFPGEKNGAVDVIEVPESAEDITAFLKKYVLERKPCKIKGVVSQDVLLKGLNPANITTALPADEILQVERKVEGGFGSGEKRILLTLGEFMRRLGEGEGNLYLTTQYAEDKDAEDDDYEGGSQRVAQEAEEFYNESESEEELEEDEIAAFPSADEFSDGGSFSMDNAHDDFDEINSPEDDQPEAQLETGALSAAEAEQRVRELYQPPMNHLVNRLPETPEFMKKLIPQQINLWIGSTAGTETNDDAFLSKFDPQAPKMGLGRFVPSGGSSSGLHHDHADNIYVPISGRKRFTLFSPRDAAKMYTVGAIRNVYNSGVIDYAQGEQSPLWRSLRDDGAILAEVAHQELLHNASLSLDEKNRMQKFIDTDEATQNGKEPSAKLDPPSFSTVAPAIVHLDKIKDKTVREKIHAKALEKWPLFLQANRLVVDLEPGEMLYLPTGWFHEVTSFGKENAASAQDQIHVAVNYWFVPPNGETIENLYPHEDKYWPLDFERTQAAVDKVRQRAPSV
ncbi:LANO_0C01222g1_1 [Lachancea nothofagi CBS 11611]|uniref:LANO_0C01222g1_1 n=1 Tax=Lachancea nothofagi CBS 11611 TaxID=1266666 RepID=A0A1G4J3X4_9SACH|nr:LANO_0C01222g1_1 [Lachancea nothofagi CBS 11611]